jgi:tripartite-type tricarboxylate transporter receptor subunit TctC
VNARRVTPKLADALGQPVIVENRPGANSMIGAREAARAAPDGYTLFQTKAKPNSLTYASGGSGAITQMVGELLKLTAGIQVREIPYKAIGAELPDLTGGHVSTAFLSPVVIRDMVRSGKLRGIAVAARQRLSILPEVPTMAEAGYPIEGLGWNGIFVPAGTPLAIVERLQQEIARVLQIKEIQDHALALGTQAGGGRPEEFAAFVRAEIQKWGKVIKDAGIKVD